MPWADIIRLFGAKRAKYSSPQRTAMAAATTIPMLTASPWGTPESSLHAYYLVENNPEKTDFSLKVFPIGIKTLYF
jgi:hypothetical protein